MGPRRTRWLRRAAIAGVAALAMGIAARGFGVRPTPDPRRSSASDGHLPGMASESDGLGRRGASLVAPIAAEPGHGVAVGDLPDRVAAGRCVGRCGRCDRATRTCRSGGGCAFRRGSSRTSWAGSAGSRSGRRARTSSCPSAGRGRVSPASWPCRILDAPGAVIATSTRTDLFSLTSELRARRGPVWVFNPSGVGGLASTITFDPLVGCRAPKVAFERASDLIAGGDTGTGSHAARAASTGRLRADGC